MKFVILMTSAPGTWEALSADERQSVIVQHDKFTSDLEAEGNYVSSYQLGPAEEARTIHRQDTHAHLLGAGVRVGQLRLATRPSVEVEDRGRRASGPAIRGASTLSRSIPRATRSRRLVAPARPDRSETTAPS